MGVYYKGVNMPVDCIVCPFGWNGCNNQHDFVYKGSRPDNCLLIEVPEPHGRLIDADEMFDEFVAEGQRSKRYKLGEKWELNGEEIRSVISRLPTVIPANEEG